MPETQLEQARLMPERMRMMCAGTTPLEVGTGAASLTVSFGVSSLNGENLSLDELILRADTALYASKKSGRNRVAAWRPKTGEWFSLMPKLLYRWGEFARTPTLRQAQPFWLCSAVDLSCVLWVLLCDDDCKTHHVLKNNPQAC